MSNFDISVAENVRESTNMDITVKDKWPSSGMCCEIEGCETPHFHNFNTYETLAEVSLQGDQCF
jgi:hypothetical protein